MRGKLARASLPLSAVLLRPIVTVAVAVRFAFLLLFLLVFALLALLKLLSLLFLLAVHLIRLLLLAALK